jgi:short/branched chain acyl-CoA dehydrogenase
VSTDPAGLVEASRTGATLNPASPTWRSTVRAFAEKHIRPLSSEMDRTASLDPRLREQLFTSGLMAMEIPRAYGGLGLPLSGMLLGIEEIARIDPGVAVCVDVHNALVVSSLLRLGTGDQKRRFLPLLARGKAGAFALSEEQAGSDAFNLATVATPKGGGYVLNGRKRWTSNAGQADIFLVFAATGEAGAEPSAFLVERDSEGVSIGPPTEQMGVRAASTADVMLDNVVVRREQCLGGPYRGREVAVAALDVGRLGIAAQLVGLAQGALDQALSYSREREQFGRRISDFQGVQFTVASMAADVAAARALLYDAVEEVESATETTVRLTAAAIVKYFASQVAERVASQAVEIHGGNGFTRNYPVERLYRDAKVGRIYEGTSNVLLQSIAKNLLNGQGDILGLVDGR